ncbi:MAG: hypothetical protein AAF810_01075 [Cyanobacteria bacterium P01_D01_bin.36]
MSESREISEDLLETALKDVLTDEFAACWERIKDDSAVSDPEEEMADLVEWFSEQLQATIDDIVEQEPADDDDYVDEDEDEDDDDDGEEE